MDKQYSIRLVNKVYISTLTDLSSSRMLKFDAKPGLYRFSPMHGGYIFCRDKFCPDPQELVYICHGRRRDRGLGGTNHDGESIDFDHCRIYMDYFRPHLEASKVRELWNACVTYENQENFDYSSEEDVYILPEYKEKAKSEAYKRQPIWRIKAHHNIPVLFYLNRKPIDISEITLELAGNCNGSAVIWNVKYGEHPIGLAVMNYLHNMVGKRAGVGIFNYAQAFGNFSTDCIDIPDNIFDEYKCKFTPCRCEIKLSDN